MPVGDAPDSGPGGTLPPRWDGLTIWASHSAIAPHRKRFRRKPGKLFVRRHRPRPTFAWVSPDAAAITHGAAIAYVWKGHVLPRLDWDLLEWSACHLLGYAYRPRAYGIPALRDALQRAALTWPPLTFRAALHQVIDHWASDPRSNQLAANSRRLMRARHILEGWNP